VIVERGNHHQLLAKGGLYASMWNRQREAAAAREKLALVDDEAAAPNRNPPSVDEADLPIDKELSRPPIPPPPPPHHSPLCSPRPATGPRSPVGSPLSPAPWPVFACCCFGCGRRAVAPAPPLRSGAFFSPAPPRLCRRSAMEPWWPPPMGG